jgi:hypothetical protein
MTKVMRIDTDGSIEVFDLVINTQNLADELGDDDNPETPHYMQIGHLNVIYPGNGGAAGRALVAHELNLELRDKAEAEGLPTPSGNTVRWIKYGVMLYAYREDVNGEYEDIPDDIVIRAKEIARKQKEAQ